jgi:putative endonuclease
MGRGADLRSGASALVEQRCTIENMPCVYILKFPEGGFYVGSTDDMERRMKQHASGHTPSTKRLGEGKLVFKQGYETLKAARSVEYKLKSLKRSDYIAKIVQDRYIKIKPS